MILQKYKVVPLLLLVLAALAIHAIIMRPKPPLSSVFRDGTKVTVEQVSSGLNHDFHIGSKLYADFLKHWPKFLPKLPAANYYASPFKSTKDELVTWISQQTASNKFVSPGITTFIEDEHGCVFADAGGGMGSRSWDGKMEMATLEFPVFPRRQKQFKMVVQKWPGYGPFASPPVTLMISNPKQVSPVEWKPETFPIVKQSDGLKVTLNKIATICTASTRVSKETWRFEPQFEIVQNGQPTREWTCSSLKFSDVTGNTHDSFLCPREPALRLTMEFARTADARFDTNEIWSPPPMTAPAPGKFQVLKGSGAIDGVTFRLATLSGPGVVTYSNGMPINVIIVRRSRKISRNSF